MDSSPIAAWPHAAAYFTFANHEAVVVTVLLASIVATVYVIGGIMKHEKQAEEALRGLGDSADTAELAVAVED